MAWRPPPPTRMTDAGEVWANPREKALADALAAKENMRPEEADALDWQTYNKEKLVIIRANELPTYEKRHFNFRTTYHGKQVFATEKKSYKWSIISNSVAENIKVAFANVHQIGVWPVLGTVVGDGQGGARLAEVNFTTYALLHRPGLPVCNSREEPWPSAVITIGIARTLPELVDDSKYYFTHPDSRVNFCLGIKLYSPTRQMVAFLREKHGGTAKLTWALSFGTEPIGQSSIDVLAREGISQVLGLDSSCTGPGIEAFKLLLKKERFFAAFPPDMARELVVHMERDVELDFHDVQQWCLGGLNGIICPEPRRVTKEDGKRIRDGFFKMMELSRDQTSLFKYFNQGSASRGRGAGAGGAVGRVRPRPGGSGAGGSAQGGGADGPRRSKRSKN